MPFTQKQLTAITQTRGQSYIAGDRMNYAGRVAETFLRKKLYRWEDKAAKGINNALKASYADIRAYALKRAYLVGIDGNLANNRAGLSWRREVMAYTEQRLNALAADVARDAYEQSVMAYKVGYYGRAWLLQSMTRQRPVVHRLDSYGLSQQVLQPGLQEASANLSAYAAHGQEWRERYQTPIDTALLKVRTRLNTALSQEQTVNQALKSAIAEPLGLTSKPGLSSHGAYHALQVTTRESVMASSNQGAAQAYRENEGWLFAVMFLTARDNRVCRECAFRDGYIWPITDFVSGIIGLLFMPPLHYGCRCTIVPVLLPDIGDSGNAPPDDSFDEWVYNSGFGDELDPFFMDTQLESSQV